MNRTGQVLDPSALLRELWLAQAAPLATEIGAIAAFLLQAYAGLGIGLLALAVLALGLPSVRPGPGVVRVVILLAGPPLRYLLVLVAVWRTWTDAGQGLVPALVLFLGLVFALPMGAFLVAQSRARRL